MKLKFKPENFIIINSSIDLFLGLFIESQNRLNILRASFEAQNHKQDFKRMKLSIYKQIDGFQLFRKKDKCIRQIKLTLNISYSVQLQYSYNQNLQIQTINRYYDRESPCKLQNAH
ncbi:hypothetical protein pb186bvf_002797 [Paramecium bursaria]